jgi:hypothetical protein
MSGGRWVVDDPSMSHRSSPSDLTLSRPSLATALVLAALFPTWAVLRGLSLSLYFEPTEEALYAARVGHALAWPGALAVLVLVAVAVSIRWIGPDSGPALTGGVAVAITTVLGLVGLAWVSADRAMHPFGPELRALAAFAPPPGAEQRFDGRRASDHAEVTRYWYVPGAIPDVCRTATGRFETWADPDTVVNPLPRVHDACWFKALRGPEVVELRVSKPYPDRPGTVSVSVVARRA